MVVVDPDAGNRHRAVVVVPHAAPVADRAMVHSGQFVDLALLAESEPLLALIGSIHEACGPHEVSW